MGAPKNVALFKQNHACPAGGSCARDIGQRTAVAWTVKTTPDVLPHRLRLKIGGTTVFQWLSGIDLWKPSVTPLRLLTNPAWRLRVQDDVGRSDTPKADREVVINGCETGRNDDCGILVSPRTELEYLPIERWFWTKPGTFDFTLTAQRKNPDGTYTDLCEATRTYTVPALNHDDPDRQAVDYYVNGGLRSFDRERMDPDIHVRWHVTRDKEQYFQGEDWLAFHRMAVKSFDDWRTLFGYPIVTPYDGSRPVPIVDGGFSMIENTRPETNAGTFNPNCYGNGTGCAPEPWFTVLGDGTARGDDLGEKKCHYAPDRNGLVEEVPTGQRTLADFKDARGLGCVVNGSHHRLMHESNTGAFHFIATTPRDPLFWAYHKWASGYGPNYLPLLQPAALGRAGRAVEPEGSVLGKWEAIKAQGPPGITAVFPPKGIGLSTLPGIQVLFWEDVTGVAASDLTVNGSPATAVVGSGTEYVFSGFNVPVPPPAGGSTPLAIELATGNIKDGDGQAFPGDGWQFQLQPDADGDEIPDALDNCPDVANADQANTDANINATFGYHADSHNGGNGLGEDLGDACDPDDDGDTIPDVMELANGSDPLDWRDPDPCPLDPNKTDPGDCGCGRVEVPGAGGEIDCIVVQPVCSAPAVTIDGGHHQRASGPPTCDDDDSCTTDACNEPTGCAHTAIAGFDGLACRLGRLGASDACGADPIDAKLGRALRAGVKAAQVASTKARAATKAKKRSKLLKRVSQILTRLSPKIAKAASKQRISPACRGLLDTHVEAARALLPPLR